MRNTQLAIAGFEDRGCESRNVGCLRLLSGAEKGKEISPPLDPTERNTAMSIP